MKFRIAFESNGYLLVYFYEITYNGDKKEFYVDTYKKINNEVIKGDE